MDVHNQHSSSHDHLISSFKQAQVVVIMVPLPAQSHLNQLLHLSCLISSYDIPVHYVGSATHLRQAKLRFNGLNYLDVAKIHFHEFPIPPFVSPPPNPNASTKFPSHLLPSFEASLHLRQPVAALLHKLSPTARRIIVIHDALMDSVIQDTASVPNAESYAFYAGSAFTCFFDQWELVGKPFPVEEEPEGLPSVEGCYTSELLNFAAIQSDFVKFRAGNILNTCRFIDAPYIDLLGQLCAQEKQWAIAPVNSATISEDRDSCNQHKSLEWLDKQAPKSVIFVSFGTTTSMSNEQIKELAIGLEQSEQKFIWVLREADKANIFEGDVKRAELPEGYEERVKEVGMVVRDWVPQLQILGHPSTGGFMSHCGWNSCMESITMGVPIAAWPMHCDQPKNAFLVTDILKVGTVVNQWAHREELVTSSAIAKAIKSLMATKKGEEIRTRAEELGGTIRQSMKEGAVTRMELDSFIAHISR